MLENKKDLALELFKAANEDYVSYAQFAELLRTFADNVKAAKDDFKAKLDEKTLEYLRRYNGITSLIDETLAQIEADVTKKADGPETRAQLERLRNDMVKLAAEIRADIPEIPPALNLAPIERELARVRDLIPPKVDGVALWKALNDMYQELQSYAKEMTSLRNNHAPGIRVLGGARGFQLLVDGGKKGQVNYVNFVAGTGVSLSYNRANGRNDITFNASGGGGSLAILAATGTVNDSNTSFTFASTPVVVIVNGAAYRNGNGAAISGAAVTLDNPVGTGGDIYALG